MIYSDLPLERFIRASLPSGQGRKTIYAAELLGVRFEFGGRVFYYVIKNRRGSCGYCLAGYIEDQLAIDLESERVHVCESDPMEMRLNGLLDMEDWRGMLERL